MYLSKSTGISIPVIELQDTLAPDSYLKANTGLHSEQSLSADPEDALYCSTA
jgi:hypothetical protein